MAIPSKHYLIGTTGTVTTAEGIYRDIAIQVGVSTINPLHISVQFGDNPEGLISRELIRHGLESNEPLGLGIFRVYTRATAEGGSLMIHFHDGQTWSSLALNATDVTEFLLVADVIVPENGISRSVDEAVAKFFADN